MKSKKNLVPPRGKSLDNLVVVLCGKRTGSTFLCDALGSHPDIQSYNELFMKKGKKAKGVSYYAPMKEQKRWSPGKYLEYISEKNTTPYTAFKLIYVQADNNNLLPLLKNKKIKIIHLVREDVLDIAISKFTKQITTIQKIPNTTKEILMAIEHYVEKVKNIKKWCNKHGGVLEVSYEDIIGKTEGKISNIKKVGAFNVKSTQKTYIDPHINKKICDYLSINNIPMWSTITKKNKGSKKDYLGNKYYILEKELKKYKKLYNSIRWE